MEMLFIVNNSFFSNEYLRMSKMGANVPFSQKIMK
jgi:hypothetical protein